MIFLLQNREDVHAYAAIADREFVPVLSLISYLFSAVLLEVGEANKDLETGIYRNFFTDS